MPRSFSILTARLASGSPPVPVNFCLAMKGASSFIYAVVRTAIGFPTAARIISLVQPAQHR
jgi:hypothetical protein